MLVRNFVYIPYCGEEWEFSHKHVFHLRTCPPVQITGNQLTISAVLKLSASYLSITTIPKVITDSTPLIVMTQLHSSLRRWWTITSKPQVTRCTSCTMCMNIESTMQHWCLVLILWQSYIVCRKQSIHFPTRSVNMLEYILAYLYYSDMHLNSCQYIIV